MGYMYISCTTPDGYLVDHNGVYAPVLEGNNIVVPGLYYCYSSEGFDDLTYQKHSSGYPSSAFVEKIDNNHIILEVGNDMLAMNKTGNKYVIDNRRRIYLMNLEHGNFLFVDGRNRFYFRLSDGQVR